MIARVGHVEVAARIQRDRPRIIQLAGATAGSAEDLQRPLLGIEDLDPAVAELTDVLAAGLVDLHVVRVTEFAQAAPGPAAGLQPFTARRKDLDAMIARVGHVDPIIRAHAEPFGPVELAIARAGASEAEQRMMIRAGERLN